MAKDRYEFPATGTVTDSWTPAANPIYPAYDNQKDLGIVRVRSAGSTELNYGSSVWINGLRREYRGVTDVDKAGYENFKDMVGGAKFRYTDDLGVPHEVTFAEDTRPYQLREGENWNFGHVLRESLSPHPSLKKIPLGFHRDLLFYAALTTGLRAFSRWDSAGTFTRASVGTSLGSDGLVKKAAAGEARFDHDSSGNPLGILIEKQITNYLTRSEDYNHADWIKGIVTVTPDDTVAPDGTTTADKLDYTATNSQVRQVSGIASVSKTFFNSVYMKVASGTTTVRMFIRDGATGTAVVSNKVVTTTWQRFDLSVAFGAGDTVGNVEAGYDGNGVAIGEVFTWGAQLEENTFLTSYIPTVASTVTRNADQLTYVSDGNLSAEQGTIICVGDLLTLGSDQAFVYLDNGTGSEIMRLLAQSTNVPSLAVVDGGATQADIIASGGADDFVAGVAKKQAMAFKANDFELVTSGVSRGTDTSGTLPTVTTIRLGQNSAGANQLTGHIRDLMILNPRLTAAEITTIHDLL